MRFIYRVLDPVGGEHRQLDREAFKAMLVELQQQFGKDSEFELSADVIREDAEPSIAAPIVINGLSNSGANAA